MLKTCGKIFILFLIIVGIFVSITNFSPKTYALQCPEEVEGHVYDVGDCWTCFDGGSECWMCSRTLEC